MKRLIFLILPLLLLLACSKSIEDTEVMTRDYLDLTETAGGLGLSTWEALTGDLASGDLLGITDVSDTTQSSDGTSKKIVVTDLLDYMNDNLDFLFVEDDTAPVLGGNLQVGANEIQSTGNVVFQLGDAAGSNILEIEDSGNVTVASINSDGDIDGTDLTADTGYFSGTLQGYTKVTNKSTATTLTDAEMNGIVFVSSAVTTTLPAVEIGQTACFYSTGANTIIIDPNSSDRIRLNGTALTDGYTIENTSATAGDFICIIGDSASGWTTLGSSGTWADGGAT